MENYSYEESITSGYLAGLGVFGTVIYLAIIVLIVVGLWKMFEKAGKPGWAALVPVYNLIIILEIVGKPLWWIFLLLIPCVNIVVGIWVTNLLMKSFGKDVIYTVLALIFPFVVYPLLGLGSDRYLGPTAAEAQNSNSFNNQNTYKNPFDNNDNRPQDPTV